MTKLSPDAGGLRTWLASGHCSGLLPLHMAHAYFPESVNKPSEHLGEFLDVLHLLLENLIDSFEVEAKIIMD